MRTTIASKEKVLFDPHKSRTWQWPGGHGWSIFRPFTHPRKRLDWHIRYGDGTEASGIAGIDDVKLGNIEIKGQTVQLAQSYSGTQFSEGSADGILGLAFSHLNSVVPGPISTPLDSMIEKNLIPEKLFSVDLNVGRESFFTFGYVDEQVKAAAGGETHWVEVDSRGGFWKFDSLWAKVGGKHLRRRGGAAIADTGSNLILTHPHICWMIYQRIEGAIYDPRQPGWIYPKTSKVPEVSFSIGKDERCMIVIDELNMHHVELNRHYYYGAIQDNPAYESGGPQFDVFGTPFFRQVYAIFDVERERFGVLKKRHHEMMRSESPLHEDNAKQTAEVEDSPDGNIYQERPRRQSTIIELERVLADEDLHP
jgi:Eukaryotic aspartyl protease